MMNKIKIIPINFLFIDDMYQRKINKNRVKKLIKEWDDDISLPLLINKRKNGMYSVIDGQHRLQRYIAEGDENICCKVLEGLTIEEEAKLFQKVNINRNAPTSLEVFKASLAAKDKIYLEIEEIVYKNEYDFPFISPSLNAPTEKTKSNQIRAVGTLRRIAYDRNKNTGMEILNNTLKTIRLVWGNDKNAISGEMLSGMARFLKGVEDVEYFDRNRFIETLQKKHAFEIIRNAKKYKIMYQGEMETNVAIALIDVYNFRLKNARLQVNDILKTDKSTFVEREQIA